MFQFIVYLFSDVYFAFPDLYEVIFCKMRSTPDDPQHIENPACVDGQRVKICKTNPVVEVIVDISHFLLAINSSANVIIYTLRGLLSTLSYLFGFFLTYSVKK